jgi:hypothetical protein
MWKFEANRIKNERERAVSDDTYENFEKCMKKIPVSGFWAIFQ